MADVYMSDYLRESFNPESDKYLLELLPPRDEVLAEMELYAVQKDFPFIGPLAGNLLTILARTMNATRVFELGSGYGYSAIHFARGMAPGCKVICTDGNEENKVKAEAYFRRAGLADCIDFHVGDAVSILNSYAGPFDIILMDINKEQYAEAFHAAWPKLRVGGLFIADNLLWHGQVLTDDQKPSTQGVRALTRLLHETPGAQTAIIPVRDGVSVTVKLA